MIDIRQKVIDDRKARVQRLKQIVEKNRAEQKMLEKWKKVTSVVILFTIIALIAYDVLTFDEGGADSTISRICFLFMRGHPTLAFAAGALLGHLTWSNSEMTTSRAAELWALGLGGALLVAMDIFHVLPPVLPLWPFAVGIPVGHIFFGQNVAPLARAARAVQWHWRCGG